MELMTRRTPILNEVKQPLERCRFAANILFTQYSDRRPPGKYLDRRPDTSKGPSWSFRSTMTLVIVNQLRHPKSYSAPAIEKCRVLLPRLTYHQAKRPWRDQTCRGGRTDG